MKRSKAKFTLKDLPVDQKLARTRQMVEALEKHPAYAKPHHRRTIAQAREALDAATEETKQSQLLRSQAQASTARRNALLRQMEKWSRSMAYMVASESDGDAAAILSTGADLEAEKLPLGLPPALTGGRARPATHTGTIDFRWKSLRRRCGYFVEMTTTPDDEQSWQRVGFVYTSAKCLISGLTPGRVYWFRVAARFRGDYGPWSNPVSARAA